MAVPGNEISVSLRTKDPAEAKRRLGPVLDQHAALFDDMRRRQTLTEDDIQTAVWDHYTDSLAADDARRAALPTPADIEVALDAATIGRQPHPAGSGIFDAINSMTEVEILMGRAKWHAHRKAARLARLRADLSTGDTRLIEPVADAFLLKHSFKMEKGDARYPDLCRKLMRAEIEHLERYAERERGDYSGRPADPIIAEPVIRTDAAMTPPAEGETIMGMFAKYEKANPNDIQSDSMKQARRDVQHFADFVGARVRPSKITKVMVGDWQDLLTDYPVRATDTNIFKGMSPQEVVAANKALKTPKPTLARQTVRRYMGSLSGFCDWLSDKRGVLPANPVNGMMLKKADPTNPRNTFKDDALKTLFTSPLFTAAKGDEWRNLDKPGNVAVRDHRYWIPLVMLYSGARPGEVAQLFVGDVRQEQGVWIMNITDEGDKRTKTVGSRRVVPIHSALIKLGFLHHVERQRAAGEVQVFPEIEILKEGQIAAQFSREFNRYLTKVGVKTGRDIVTYSLRHTFIDRARMAGFLDPVIAIIVGHETGANKKTMTSGYGVEQHGTLPWRQKLVEAVVYGLSALD
jgi:integrase